jgi:hypothetical protein
MKKLLGCFLCVMLLVFGAALSVQADAIDLGDATVAVYNQPDWPVFIGYSTGPNKGFDYTDYKKQNDTDSQPANFDEGILTSPIYSGTALDELINGYGGVGKYADFTGVGLTPLIAIDLNQSNPGDHATAEYLINSLMVRIDYGGGLTDAYKYVELLFQEETGNGKSDFVVSGIDLTGAQSLQFVLDFGNRVGDLFGDNTNGKENFFLVNSDAPSVPEPATMLLLGSGVLFLGVFGRKRFKK